MKDTSGLFCATAVALLVGLGGAAAEAPTMKMTTPIPDSIVTPDTIESRIGQLNFFDGYPDDATADKIYDNLDFMRGVDAARRDRTSRVRQFAPVSTTEAIDRWLRSR